MITLLAMMHRHALLEEAIGYCFTAGTNWLILTGDKSNGKSTYSSMVKILGEENVLWCSEPERTWRRLRPPNVRAIGEHCDDMGDER